MWLFIKNRGYNVRNFYKLELTRTRTRTVFNIYEVEEGEIRLTKTSSVHPNEAVSFKETLYRVLSEKFVVFEDKNATTTTWINKDFIKTIEVKATDENAISIKVELTVDGVTETHCVASNYPEFNLFWLRNFKNNVYDDITLTVPSPEVLSKKGRKGRIEKVVNI